MRSFEELTFREIGERIETGETTATALYARAIVLLKRSLR